LSQHNGAIFGKKVLSGKYRFLDKFYPDLVALCWNEGYDGSPHIDGQDKYWIRIDIFKTEGAS
jgi:hypothetical protein